MSKTKIMVNFGCGGTYHSAWLNYDLKPTSDSVNSCDLNKRLPIADNEVDVVYHSNVLEHLSKDNGFQFLKECHRILTRGGIIRIAIPDLEQLCRNYLSNLENARKSNSSFNLEYEWSVIQLIDQLTRENPGGEMEKFISKYGKENSNFFIKQIGIIAKEIISSTHQYSSKIVFPNSNSRKLLSFIKHKLLSLFSLRITMFRLSKEEKKLIEDGKFHSSGVLHKWMYDSYSLKTILIRLGFDKITTRTAYQSSIDNWDNFNLEVDSNGNILKPDSLVIEAIKI